VPTLDDASLLQRHYAAQELLHDHVVPPEKRGSMLALVAWGDDWLAVRRLLMRSQTDAQPERSGAPLSGLGEAARRRPGPVRLP
jgi:hypothetical protein